MRFPTVPLRATLVTFSDLGRVFAAGSMVTSFSEGRLLVLLGLVLEPDALDGVLLLEPLFGERSRLGHFGVGRGRRVVCVTVPEDTAEAACIGEAVRGGDGGAGAAMEVAIAPAVRALLKFSRESGLSLPIPKVAVESEDIITIRLITCDWV